jgi:hypothetical protein
MAKTKPFASLHLSILHIFHMVLTASSRISLTNQNVFRAPSLRWRKGFPARSRKFPAPPNRENFGSTLKALRNLWVYFRKLPEKISNTLQISLRAGNSSPRSVRGGLRRQPGNRGKFPGGRGSQRLESVIQAMNDSAAA